MKAISTFRWRRTNWRVCPWKSLRTAAASIVVVIAIAFLLDHWVLARLERQGMLASDAWRRHNRIVVSNHESKDRKISFSQQSFATSPGVRAWTGHPVSKERSKPHRLLVMGDSFVWGSPYLTLNHMWWRQLDIELKRRGYFDVEVIAAGVSGMSTREELDLARLVVPEFRPDLIIWGFVTNDPDERIVKQINTSQLAPPIPSRAQAVLQRFLPRLFDLFKTRRSEKLAKSYIGPEYGYEYSDWLRRIHDGKNFELYRQTVEAVGMFLTEAKTPGLMVTLPEAPIADRFAFSYDKVVPLWREAGIPVQDNLPALVKRFPHVETTGPQAIVWGINPADGHPGPRSTAMLAQLTADRLEQDYPQLLGEKTSPPIEIRINDWLPFDLNINPIGDGKFELTYPDTDQFLPTMPLEIPTVLVSLEQPELIRKIRLHGTGLKSARMWLSTYDPAEFYDTQEWNDLGSKDGSALVWPVPSDQASRKASVVLFQASVEFKDRRLILELLKSAAPQSSVEGRTSP